MVGWVGLVGMPKSGNTEDPGPKPHWMWPIAICVTLAECALSVSAVFRVAFGGWRGWQGGGSSGRVVAVVAGWLQ